MERNAIGPSPGHTVEQEDRHASWLELFFDLVFVLAVTQVADALDHDLSPAGSCISYWSFFHSGGAGSVSASTSAAFLAKTTSSAC